MQPLLDATHNPNLRSWVKSANQKDTDFPIQNLPFGVFQSRSHTEPARIGVAIGDQILDLTACLTMGLLPNLPEPIQTACRAPNLNMLMALGRSPVALLRQQLSELLRYNEEAPPIAHNILIPMAEATMLLPAAVGDYTDFYASISHATTVGKLFRPDNPLLPNYKHVPIAYHGRASSLVPSGTSIRRPQGQRKNPKETVPQFAPTHMLDYEAEVGCLIGAGNSLGEPIAIDQAEAHIFGLCLVNDWSARDIQAWEYQPLGPFLAKNFATTLSPWVVTLEALAPFRCAALSRPEGDPDPLPYLVSSANTGLGGLDLTIEVFLRSASMRATGHAPLRLSRASFRHLYWTIAQMVTHHTSNGCNLRPGDLLASGTVSEAEAGTQGCLLEITQRGDRPLELPTGEQRAFLLDGDEIILRGFCEKAGFARIGFGTCQGMIVAASG